MKGEWKCCFHKTLVFVGELIVAGMVAGLLSACSTLNSDRPSLRDRDGAWLSDAHRWWEVSQGWSDTERRKFWFTSQGSRLIPYDWFLHLEQAGSDALFRAPANMERLGYVPTPVHKTWNPDGLPIGLARGRSDEEGTDWLGPTCAFCHSNKMLVGSKTLFIDGAPSLGDFESFHRELMEALWMAWSQEEKFDRFSHRVLGPDAYPEQRRKLKGRMQVLTQILAIKYEQNKAQHPYGYGRVDAIGAIFNQITAQVLKQPDAWYPADAPVSYPFLWGASQSSVVQWNGLSPNNNAGFGPLMRNVGEVLGVFGLVDVVNRSGDDYLRAENTPADHLAEGSRFGYKSSVNIDNLGKLEALIKKLRSPPWPDNLLPAPEPKKVARGEQLYQRRCVRCHSLVSRSAEGESYKPKMIPVTVLGTDATLLDNFLMATNERIGKPWPSGLLEGTHRSIVGGPRYGATLPTTDAGKPVSPRAEALITVGLGVVLGQPRSTVKAAYKSFSEAEVQQNFDPRSYKARPLNGIWATPPYLHNGSVPNLFEIVSAPEDRSETFYIGSREFDPVNVGYKTEPGENAFLFDTRLKGNSNRGHVYGRGLTEQQRYDLVEYLKTL